MRVWKVLTLGFLAAACGDEKSDGGGSSSIDGKKISELSGTELKTLCSWLSAEAKKSTLSDEQFCTQDSVGFAETKAECEEYRDECLADLEDEDEDDCEDFNATKDCTATVKAYKACVSDFQKAYDAAGKKASCDKPGEDSFTELPDSCADLSEDCIEVDVSLGGLKLR